MLLQEATAGVVLNFFCCKSVRNKGDQKSISKMIVATTTQNETTTQTKMNEATATTVCPSIEGGH